MPIARQKATNANSGAAVDLKSNFGTAAGDVLATNISAIISVTVDTNIAFDKADASAAATAMTNGTTAGNGQSFVIPAGTAINVQNFNPATTWVRAVGAAGGIVSMLFT